MYIKLGDEVKVVKRVNDKRTIHKAFMGMIGGVVFIHSSKSWPIVVKFESSDGNVTANRFWESELEVIKYVPSVINKERMEFLVHKHMSNIFNDADVQSDILELVWDDYIARNDSKLNDTDDMKLSELFHNTYDRYIQTRGPLLARDQPIYVCTHQDGDGGKHCPLIHDKENFVVNFPVWCIGACKWCERQVNI